MVHLFFVTQSNFFSHMKQCPPNCIRQVLIQKFCVILRIILRRSAGRMIYHPHRLHLNGDPLLALQIHLVQVLGAHLSRFHRSCQLQHAVGQRGLAVINVRDDHEVSDIPRIGHNISPFDYSAVHHF